MATETIVCLTDIDSIEIYEWGRFVTIEFRSVSPTLIYDFSLETAAMMADGMWAKSKVEDEPCDTFFGLDGQTFCAIPAVMASIAERLRQEIAKAKGGPSCPTPSA